MYSNFSSFITIHKTFVLVASNGSISVTIWNSTHLHTIFFLTVTSTMTSKILTFPPESPCILVTSKQRCILYYYENFFYVFINLCRYKNNRSFRRRQKTYFTISAIHNPTEFSGMNIRTDTTATTTEHNVVLFKQQIQTTSL